MVTKNQQHQLDQLLDRMKQANTGDPECDHSDADDILCEALKILGQNELVAEWIKVEKWYA